MSLSIPEATTRSGQCGSVDIGLVAARAVENPNTSVPPFRCVCPGTKKATSWIVLEGTSAMKKNMLKKIGKLRPWGRATAKLYESGEPLLKCYDPATRLQMQCDKSWQRLATEKVLCASRDNDFGSLEFNHDAMRQIFREPNKWAVPIPENVLPPPQTGHQHALRAHIRNTHAMWAIDFAHAANYHPVILSPARIEQRKGYDTIREFYGATDHTGHVQKTRLIGFRGSCKQPNGMCHLIICTDVGNYVKVETMCISLSNGSPWLLSTQDFVGITSSQEHRTDWDINEFGHVEWTTHIRGGGTYSEVPWDFNSDKIKVRGPDGSIVICTVEKVKPCGSDHSMVLITPSRYILPGSKYIPGAEKDNKAPWLTRLEPIVLHGKKNDYIAFRQDVSDGVFISAKCGSSFVEIPMDRLNDLLVYDDFHSIAAAKAAMNRNDIAFANMAFDLGSENLKRLQTAPLTYTVQLRRAVKKINLIYTQQELDAKKKADADNQDKDDSKKTPPNKKRANKQVKTPQQQPPAPPNPPSPPQSVSEPSTPTLEPSQSGQTSLTSTTASIASSENPPTSHDAESDDDDEEELTDEQIGNLLKYGNKDGPIKGIRLGNVENRTPRD